MASLHRCRHLKQRTGPFQLLQLTFVLNSLLAQPCAGDTVVTEAALALPCLPGAHRSVGETSLFPVRDDPECAELEWGSP